MLVFSHLDLFLKHITVNSKLNWGYCAIHLHMSEVNRSFSDWNYRFNMIQNSPVCVLLPVIIKFDMHITKTEELIHAIFTAHSVSQFSTYKHTHSPLRSYWGPYKVNERRAVPVNITNCGVCFKCLMDYIDLSSTFAWGCTALRHEISF